MAQPDSNNAEGFIFSCYPKEKIEIKRAARTLNYRTPFDLIRAALRDSKLVKKSEINEPRKVDGVI